jgi:hypothetical protein
MNYITNCRKCGQPLPQAVPDNRIATGTGICDSCLQALDEELQSRNKFIVPGLDQPYVP